VEKNYNQQMESLETIQALHLAVQTLSEIENLSIDDDIKEQLTNKVLATIGIEINQDKQYEPGSQEKIIRTIRKLGGSATRAEIASNTGMNPNSISSLLNQLTKKRTVEKIQLKKSPVRNRRGLEPEYIYKLLENE
jgi:transcription initiation factor IIE alpha subunit